MDLYWTLEVLTIYLHKPATDVTKPIKKDHYKRFPQCSEISAIEN